MDFKDIPQFVKEGDWECTYSIDGFIRSIDNWVIGEDVYEDAKLQLNPDFQRGNVWNEEQQISFVEFILQGGRTGRVIYLNNPKWNSTDGEYNEFVCVDGLQRITAIRRFINNEIKALGFYYKGFTGNTRTLKGMRVNINSLKSKKEVLEWYIQMNSGGTIHSKDEIERVKDILAKL